MNIEIGKDGYPTSDTLDAIANKKLGFKELINSIEPLFEINGSFEVNGDSYSLFTNNCPQCERVINALRKNTSFWLICWRMSKYNGHYEFKIPT